MQAPIPDSYYSIQDAAHLLGCSQRKLFGVLRMERRLDSNNYPCKQWLNNGHLKVSTGSWNHPSTGTRLYCRPLISASGILAVQSLFENSRINV
jgi:phage antirepressor YoqD-like protein